MEASALETFLEAQEQSLRDMLLHFKGSKDAIRYLNQHAANISKFAKDALYGARNKIVQAPNVDTVKSLLPHPEKASNIQQDSFKEVSVTMERKIELWSKSATVEAEKLQFAEKVVKSMKKELDRLYDKLETLKQRQDPVVFYQQAATEKRIQSLHEELSDMKNNVKDLRGFHESNKILALPMRK